MLCINCIFIHLEDDEAETYYCRFVNKKINGTYDDDGCDNGLDADYIVKYHDKIKTFLKV